MHLLPCFHYISPTFSGPNFYIISISPKTITTHLYCQHHLKSNKFCHERYFLMYFVDVCGGKNHLEKFWKCVIFFLEKFGKPYTIFCTNAEYCKLRPTNGWDWYTSLGDPSKFQRVLHLAFITAATSLTGGQPNFARCLAVSCVGTHFRGLLPLTEFCQVQNSL